MKEQNNRQVKRLTSITVTGLILVAVPVSSVLIMLIYSLFRNAERVVVTSAEGPSTVYLDSCGIPTEVFFIIVAVLFLSGIILLSWVGFRRFRREDRQQGEKK